MAEGGVFDGLPSVQLLEDGRRLKLLADFKFKDRDGRDWMAPKDWVVDGASIPQALWILGGPLEGKYRDASIIHDYYCDRHLHTWQATHRVFYNGMIARHVDGLRAKAMYYAVYKFGPRWEIVLPPGHALDGRPGLTGARPTAARVIQTQTTQAGAEPEVERALAFVETNNPSLDEIERLADSGELESPAP